MTTRRPSWALWFQLSFTSSDSSWTRVSMSVQNPLIYFPFCGSSSSKGSLAIIKTRQLCDYTTQTEISPLMAALKEEASKSGGAGQTQPSTSLIVTSICPRASFWPRAKHPWRSRLPEAQTGASLMVCFYPSQPGDCSPLYPHPQVACL